MKVILDNVFKEVRGDIFKEAVVYAFIKYYQEYGNLNIPFITFTGNSNEMV